MSLCTCAVRLIYYKDSEREAIKPHHEVVREGACGALSEPGMETTLPTKLQCPKTGWTTSAKSTHFRSPQGEPLDVVFDAPKVSRELFDSRLGLPDKPYGSGVWRFKELVHPDLPMDCVVSRPEGNTPLYESDSLRRYTKVKSLFIKHEGMNPTGSFKDRGMTVAVSQAVHVGARAVVCASTGNTSAAVAAYAAIRQIPAIILVPEGKTALGKMSQALAYGAKTVIVRGNFDDAMEMVQQAGDELGLYLLNSLNPFRIQGQQTIIWEAIQQLKWSVPDWFVFPAGNLGNTSAFGKALKVAFELGLINKVPRLLAVQAHGANPFYTAYKNNWADTVAIRPETIATAIRIGNPVSDGRARASMAYTNGVVSEVTDPEILDAKAMVDAAGIGAEPASCASIAGLKRAVQDGLIKPTDTVVAILTGHLLKDPDVTIAYHKAGAHERSNPPVIIDPTLDALAAVVRQAEMAND